MKKLLILIDTVSNKKELFTKEISKRLSHKFGVSMAKFSDLIFEIEKGKVTIFISGLDVYISEFDLVYFRRAGSGFSIVAGNTALALDALGVKYFDSAWKDGPLGNKLTSLIKLAVAGAPIIPTFYCWANTIETNKEKIIAKLGFPIVAKELSAQLGRGVYLIKKEEDFADLPLKFEERFTNNQYLFQKYIEVVDEYRLLVLKDRVGVIERKIITNKNEFRHNVALGAEEEFLEVEKVPNEMYEIAVNASRSLGIEIAGADIAIDKDGTHWLLEVNRGPGLTYDTVISPEIDELARFFIQELEHIEKKKTHG